MGRELRRVPLDFSWQLERPWPGFINPHYKKCAACDGRGETLAMGRLSALCAHLMLSGDDASRGKCHPYFAGREISWHGTEGRHCGSDMVQLADALAGRPAGFMGHDACDRWSAAKKIIAAAGLPDTWGTCTECDGHGIAREAYADYEAWIAEDPPHGDGYQIWETVSEGSPISPVFSTPEELARYMAGKKWGADSGSSYDAWLRFITGPGWAPSLVSDGHGVRDGVDTIFGTVNS